MVDSLKVLKEDCGEYLTGLRRSRGAAAEGDTPKGPEKDVGFKVGEPVAYWDKGLGKWINTVVGAVHVDESLTTPLSLPNSGMGVRLAGLGSEGYLRYWWGPGLNWV